MQAWASASSWDSWGIPKVLPLDVIIGNRADDHHLKDRYLGKRNCLSSEGSHTRPPRANPEAGAWKLWNRGPESGTCSVGACVSDAIVRHENICARRS